MLHKLTLYLFFLVTVITLSNCKKIQIPAPVGTITNAQVFTTDEQAKAAVSGLYYNMINNFQSLTSSSMTILGGMSADEINLYGQSNLNYYQFQANTLTSSNQYIKNNMWASTFSTIYSANSIIANLAVYKGVNDSLKNEFIGEAKFIRAFCNFYLVNIFGDIPLVTSINWRETQSFSRTSTDKVYESIIADLHDAQNALPEDYSSTKGERTVATKWAAIALLARVYLYTGDWKDAETQASLVIGNSTLYNLPADLNAVFLANSSEAIWQLQQSNKLPDYFTSTPEGFQLIPAVFNDYFAPLVYLTKPLINAFEPGDLRKSKWVDSTITVYDSLKYYIPYKYKAGPNEAKPNGNYSEYYMVLRLAEQYLIRSEARAHLNEGNAVDDLNTIRNRAGLPNYREAGSSLLNAIAHERQIELFMEWGHRWLDLKRTNQAINVLSETKGYPIIKNELLYPIPVYDLQTDPNLTQNPGY